MSPRGDSLSEVYICQAAELGSFRDQNKEYHTDHTHVAVRQNSPLPE
jgi:hypothetical protein